MRYLFGKFIFDASTHELLKNKANVSIEPKVFNLLLFLIENRSRVVTKDDLVDAIWEGRFVSEAAVSSAVSAARKAIGDDGKNQRSIKTVHGLGFRFVHPVTETSGQDGNGSRSEPAQPFQEIRYCRSAEGTRIAYAIAGHGPPLVKAANWLNHLEFDWESPLWKHFFCSLVSEHRLFRYDASGNGLSSWDAKDFSMERQVEDLEAVIQASALEQFPMIGISQGCAKAFMYAARHHSA